MNATTTDSKILATKEYGDGISVQILACRCHVAGSLHVVFRDDDAEESFGIFILPPHLAPNVDAAIAFADKKMNKAGA